MAGEYKIRIVTESTGTGAKDAKKEIEEIAKAAKDAEKAVDAIDPLEDLAREASAGFEAMRARLKAVDDGLKNVRGFDAMEEGAEDALDTLEKLEAELKQVNAQLGKTKIGSENFNALSGRADELKGKIREASGAQEGLAGSGAIGKLAGLAAGYFTITKALDGLKFAISAAAAAEESAQRIRQAGANKGIFDPGFVDEVRKFGEELERATGIQDSAIESAVQRLLPNVDASELRGALEVIENLTPIYGDIESATNAWTKALNGNFDSLREQGFVLDATSDKTEKLAQIQEAAAKRGAGLLRASSAGLNSEWDRLKDNAGDVAASFGGALAEATGLSSILTSVADSLSELSGKASGANAELERFSTIDSGLDQKRADAEAYAASLGTVQAAVERGSAALTRQISELERAKKFEDELARATLDRAIANIEASDAPESEKKAAIGELRGQASEEEVKRQLDLIEKEKAARIAANEAAEKAIAEAKEAAQLAAIRQQAARDYDAAISGVNRQIGERETDRANAAKKAGSSAGIEGGLQSLINPAAFGKSIIAGRAEGQKIYEAGKPEIDALKARLAELEAEREARGLGTPETEAIRGDAAVSARDTVTSKGAAAIEENARIIAELERQAAQIQQLSSIRQETLQVRTRATVETSRRTEETARQRDLSGDVRGVVGAGTGLEKSLRGRAAESGNAQAGPFVDKFASAVNQLDSGNDLGGAVAQILPILEQLTTKVVSIDQKTKQQAAEMLRRVERLQQQIRTNPPN